MYKLYCQDTLDDLLKYSAFGLSPCSFSMYLLLGDKKKAYIHAHRLLYPVSLGGKSENDEDIVMNMMEFVEDRVPDFIRGTQENILAWMQYGGYAKAPQEKKAMFIIFSETYFLARVNRLIAKHPIS